MLNHLRHLAVGSRRGAFLFRPQGKLKDWELAGYGLYGQHVTSLSVNDRGAITAAVERGQVKYTEDWSTWKPLYQGLKHPDVYSVCFDPHSSRLFAGTSPALVYASEDGGQTWASTGETNHLSIQNAWSHPDPPHSPRVVKLLAHPIRKDCLIGGIQSGGVIVSENAGRTWRNPKAGLSRQINDLRCHPSAPERLYAVNFLGFYRSDDLGRNWRLSNHGLPYENALALCVHSLDPDKLLMAVEHPEEGHSVLFSSDNGGNSWEVAAPELPTDEGLRATCLEAGGGVYFVGTQEGFVFGSRDRKCWEIVKAELPPITTLCWVGEFQLPKGREDWNE